MVVGTVVGAVAGVAWERDEGHVETRQVFVLSGTVHAEADIAPAWVVAWNGEGQRTAKVDDEGRWSMAIAAGAYRIGATRALGIAPEAAPDVEVDGNLGGIALVLAPLDLDEIGRPAVAPRGPVTWIEGTVDGVDEGAITVEVATRYDTWLAHRIVRVRGGRYRLAVAGVPWQVNAHRWPMTGYTIDVPPERYEWYRTPWPHLDLRVRPTVTVFGQVFGEDGRPLAGVDVDGSRRDGIEATGVRARTGVDGRYAMSITAGTRVTVHAVAGYKFVADGEGPGPWQQDLYLFWADEVSTDCGYQRDGDVEAWPPSDEQLIRLRALARARRVE